jgi:hypothetical protein
MALPSNKIVAAGTRFDVLLFFVASIMICLAQPAKAAPACAAYGDQHGPNNYLYDLFVHPATTCIQYFNPSSRVVGGGNTTPACGTWAVRPEAPGFQYMSGNLPCIDWLVVRIQMPDQGLWDYSYMVVVYPDDDPLPQP